MRVVRKFDFKGAGGTRDHEHGRLVARSRLNR